MGSSESKSNPQTLPVFNASFKDLRNIFSFPLSTQSQDTAMQAGADAFLANLASVQWNIRRP